MDGRDYLKLLSLMHSAQITLAHVYIGGATKRGLLDVADSLEEIVRLIKRAAERANS